MANSFMSFSLLCFFVLLSCNLGENMAQDFPTTPNDMKSWCVAKPSATDGELMGIINYVCDEQGMPECKVIQEGGPCYSPNSFINHASVVMNLYYQKHEHGIHSCFFQGSGLTVITDPSYTGCLYDYTSTA